MCYRIVTMAVLPLLLMRFSRMQTQWGSGGGGGGGKLGVIKKEKINNRTQHPTRQLEKD